MTSPVVDTDHISECGLCSRDPPHILRDAMEISTSTSPTLKNTTVCNTDSVEMKNFAAPLGETDEIEKLQNQVKKKQDKLSRLQK